MIEEANRYKRSLLGAYYRQMAAAYDRGIEWNFTFKQWIIMWASSGKLHRRGRKRGQFVMGRFHDQGAYTIGNVKIITNSENQREAHIGRKRTPETLLKMSRAQKGKKLTDAHKAKLVVAHAGQTRTISLIARENIAKANRNPEKREKARVGMLARWARQKAEE